MKVTPDDPRLSAYVLGELSAAERREIEHAAAADPAIRISLRELEKTCRWLSATLGDRGAHALHPSQRQAVRDASRETAASGPRHAPERRGWSAVLSGAAAAAVIGLAALLFSRLGPEPENPTFAESEDGGRPPLTGPAVPGAADADGGGAAADGARGWRAVAAAGAPEAAVPPTEADGLPEAEHLPRTRDQSGFSDAAALRLPVRVGHESFGWVRRWIRERGGLPPRDAVRVEELVNAASLETAPWVDGLELGVAAAACPWDPETRLVGIQLVARGGDQADLVLESRATAGRRVLGSFGHRDDGGLPTTLPAGRANLVLLEVRGEGDDFGRLVLRRDSETVAVDLAERAGPGGAGMAHAVAMAAFGRWLRGEIDADALERAVAAAEAREPDAVRRDSLALIDEALELAAGE